MKSWIIALLALQLISLSQKSFAFESEDFGYHELKAIVGHRHHNTNSNDATRVQKFEAALNTLGIPPEQAPDFSNFVHANEVNQQDVQNSLPYIDPDKGLSRYLALVNGLFVNGNVQMFRDFFNSVINLNSLDYQQTMSTDNATTSNDSSALISRLQAVAAEAQSGSDLPLSGLKVLIDPGHMGGEEWDGMTGKFVSVQGHKVSEGSINLWTAFLVAQKLEKLGATVKLTREQMGPVSTENWQTYNTTPYVNNFFYNSMDDWMAPYLNQSIETVQASIKSDPNVKKAYSSAQRLQYFITEVDLEARSQIADQFNPDVILDIHYDASNSAKTQTTTQSLEAFVPGGFMHTETGGRLVKAQALKQLLEVRRWNQSVELADQVTQSMSSTMQVSRLADEKAYFVPPSYAQRVRDGVYARNLYITRRALSSLIVYLECMHYDYAKDFANMSVNDRTGSYHSNTFQYPNRLDEVSDGIENGFVNYFKNLKI